MKHPIYIQLLESVNVVTEIHCTKCPAETGLNGDSTETLEGFYELGWRATKNHTYCPNCAKAYLKKK